MTKKPTLKDIAEKIGVSVSTVSMVIHGKGRINNETRERVLQCAIDLGYPIHQRKREMRNNDTDVVAILFSIDEKWGFIWEFLRPIIEEIDTFMGEANYTTVIIPISEKIDNETIINRIVDTGAKVVVALHFGNASLFLNLEQNSIPVILVMNNDFQDRFHSICSDDFQGAYEGTRFLIEQGHTKIAYVDTIRPDLPRLLHDRFYGFRKALAENNIPLPKDFSLRYGIEQEAEFLEKLRLLLDKEEPPTAFFCLDDELASRVIQLLNKLGKRVPEDFSFIAPGDVLNYDSPLVPQITTMRINTTQMGKAAGQMMLSILKEEESEHQVYKIRQELVERNSCSPLADKFKSQQSKSS